MFRFVLKCVLFLLLLLFLHTLSLHTIQARKTNFRVTVAKAQPSPRLFLLDETVLDRNKKRHKNGDVRLKPAYDALIKQADIMMKDSPVSVTEKQQLPPSADKHDYLSMGTYLWPNPNTPNGLPYIGRDGQLNPEIKDIPDQENYQKMVRSVRTLALAYYFSDDEKYSQKAVSFLRTWFINPETRMNPNLTYSQIIKGSNKIGSAGVIDFGTFPGVLDGIALLFPSSSLTSSDLVSIRTWMNDYFDWLTTSEKGVAASKFTNNIGSWYDGQVVTIALFLDKKNYAAHILEEIKTKRISHQISPDGEQPEELQRTKSWDYSISNLTALANLASLAKNNGIDLWNYSTVDGRSIRSALNYVAPALESGNWPHTQIIKISPLGLPQVLRRASIEYNYSHYWEIADRFDPNAKKSLDNLLY